MNRIKKNDRVRVVFGKFKNTEGIVKVVFPKKNLAIVEGVNKVKIHKKNQDSGNAVIEKELPINMSLIALIDPKNKDKVTKISYQIVDGIKIRVTRKHKEKLV